MKTRRSSSESVRLDRPIKRSRRSDAFDKSICEVEAKEAEILEAWSPVRIVRIPES